MRGEDQVNLSVNGQSQVPPGFRFHPTEEELLLYYLKRKMASQKIDLDVIRDIDLNKLEPWDIQEKCNIGSGPQHDWYFFSLKDKRYPIGTRTNRATVAGFWKATGRDKVINSNYRRIGMRKTLVFYKGRAPHGQKSDWIMHEYRLELDHDSRGSTSVLNSTGGMGESTNSEEGWVLCRVFRKRNYQKALQSSQNSCISMHSTADPLVISKDNNILDGVHQHMDTTLKHKNIPNGHENEFNHLPGLDYPATISVQENVSPMIKEIDACSKLMNQTHAEQSTRNDSEFDWGAYVGLVDSPMNGEMEFGCSDYIDELDIWGFT